MNSRVTILGKRLYWLNLKKVAVLEKAQSRFSFSLHLPVIFSRQLAGKCMKIKNATEGIVAQLTPHGGSLLGLFLPEGS